MKLSALCNHLWAMAALFVVISSGRLCSAESDYSPAQVEEIKSSMTDLHQALTKYLVANKGIWPQVPDNIEEDDDLDKWWIKLLKTWGAAEKSFQFSGDKKKYRLSYSITIFNTSPMTGFRWRGQPWMLSKFSLPDGLKHYLITAEGRPHRSKDHSEMKLVPGKKDEYFDPDLEGEVPIAAIPEYLRALYQEVKKTWDS